MLCSYSSCSIHPKKDQASNKKLKEQTIQREREWKGYKEIAKPSWLSGEVIGLSNQTKRRQEQQEQHNKSKVPGPDQGDVGCGQFFSVRQKKDRSDRPKKVV